MHYTLATVHAADRGTVRHCIPVVTGVAYDEPSAAPAESP